MAKPRQWEPMFNGNLGLKQGHAITNMPAGALLDVQNMNLNGKGGKKTRNGCQLLFRSGATDPVLSMVHYKTSSGSVSLVIFYSGTTIRSWDPSDGSIATVRSGVSASTAWQFLNYAGRLYGVNGAVTDGSIMFDGTDEAEIGLAAPLAHVTVNIVAGGALALGAHKYLYTFYDEDTAQESEPFTVATAPSVTAAGGNLTARLSLFGSALATEQWTHYRIYRMAPSETVFTRTVSLPKATVTYDDIGDVSTGVELEYDTGQLDAGHVKPPRSKIICELGDRIIYVPETDPSGISYSRINRPYSVPSANFYPLKRDGFRVLRVENHGDYVLIHKRSGVWRMADDYGEPVRISSIGTQDFNSSISSEDQNFRLTPQGFYKMAPTEFSTTDLRDEYVGDDITDEEDLIDYDQTDEMFMVNYRGNGSRHVYAMFPDSSDVSTKALVFDRNTEQWLKYKIATNFYCGCTYEADNKEFLIFGDGYGSVFKWDEGEADGSDEEHTVLNGTSTGSNTSTTLNDTTKSWTVNELAGLRLTTRDGTGANQARRIVSNTATQIVVTPAFSTTPDVSTGYSIAAIDSWGEEFWNAEKDPHLWKRLRWIVPYLRQTGDFTVDVSVRRDFRAGADNVKTLSLQSSNSESLWGAMMWGSDEWGTETSNLQRLRFTGKYHYYSVKYRNNKAAQRFFWDGHGTVFQYLHDRNK